MKQNQKQSWDALDDGTRPALPPCTRSLKVSALGMAQLVFDDHGLEGGFAIFLALRGRRLALALCSLTLAVLTYAVLDDSKLQCVGNSVQSCAVSVAVSCVGTISLV